VLHYEPRLGGYGDNVDRSKLERAPNFTADAQPDWADRAFNDATG
jgi:hypothetical protein